MITILTGTINSGKSTWMLEDSPLHNNSDGFISIKSFNEKIHTGYDLYRPLTQEQVPFIRKLSYLPPGWLEAEKIKDAYSFSKEGFDFAAKIVDYALSQVAKPRFYLDEVGFLELSGRGFAPHLKALLKAEVDLVIAIRDFLLEKALKEFAIEKYELVKIGM